MRATLFSLAFVLTAGTTSCQVSGPDLGGGELDSLESRIMDLIGEAPATQQSSCKTIAFGSKPCGGPWTYLVYSAEHTDEAELENLVAAYNSLQDQLNREKGLMSDCAIATEPPVTLDGGYCRAATDPVPEPD
jgi:hypothetical protein